MFVKAAATVPPPDRPAFCTTCQTPERRVCLDLSRFAAAGTFHGAVTRSPAQSFQTVSALVTIPSRGLLKTVLKTETLKPKHPR